MGTAVLAEQISLARDGGLDAGDLERLQELARTMAIASRCGLGQTASRPLTTSLESFPQLWRRTLATRPDGQRPAFDIHEALEAARELAGRDSVIFPVAPEEEQR